MCFCARLGSIHRVACVGGLPTGRAPRCRGRDHLLCRALPPRRSCCTRLHAARWSPRPQPILIAKRSTSSGAEGQGGGRTAGPTPLTPVFSGLLCRWPGVERVTGEQEPHRPVPGSVLGKVMPGLEDAVSVTTAAASQTISPTPRTHGVEPSDVATRPATATANPTNPTRRPQTAILQRPLPCCNSGEPSMPAIVHVRARPVTGSRNRSPSAMPVRPYEAPRDPGETNRSLPRFQG
jgi:hypothetical protein